MIKVGFEVHEVELSDEALALLGVELEALLATEENLKKRMRVVRKELRTGLGERGVAVEYAYDFEKKVVRITSAAIGPDWATERPMTLEERQLDLPK